jgi:hypothetical protein
MLLQYPPLQEYQLPSLMVRLLRWELQHAIPWRGVFSNALNEVPFVHQDGTPYGHVSPDVLRDITSNESGSCPRDPRIASSTEGNEVGVGLDLSGECQKNADGYVCLHSDGLEA